VNRSFQYDTHNNSIQNHAPITNNLVGGVVGGSFLNQSYEYPSGLTGAGANYPQGGGATVISTNAVNNIQPNPGSTVSQGAMHPFLNYAINQGGIQAINPNGGNKS
jgi:hypothetical protein